MRRQRNIAQIKQQNRSPEKELNKMGTNNLLDAEFKIQVIRMLNELRGRADDFRRIFNSIKKRHRKHKKEPIRNEGYTN